MDNHGNPDDYELPPGNECPSEPELESETDAIVAGIAVWALGIGGVVAIAFFAAWAA